MDGPWDPEAGQDPELNAAAIEQKEATLTVAPKRDRTNRAPFDWNEKLDGPWVSPLNQGDKEASLLHVFTDADTSVK